ncbi:uncharacterized protein LOC121466787 [Drosophila elegans]|uniref:uncharacterized protein LOC121466787 n=1 Tax=Drosophila elegans TaxID=30023 RepID=UPI001BC855FB|nr:uncharacterized protein LOC121466787 [Drosophila elegans]
MGSNNVSVWDSLAAVKVWVGVNPSPQSCEPEAGQEPKWVPIMCQFGIPSSQSRCESLAAVMCTRSLVGAQMGSNNMSVWNSLAAVKVWFGCVPRRSRVHLEPVGAQMGSNVSVWNSLAAVKVWFGCIPRRSRVHPKPVRSPSVVQTSSSIRAD